MIIDFAALIIIIFITLTIGIISVITAKSVLQRIILIGIYSGLFIYNGVGAAYTDVPNYYIFYYLIFMLAFAFSFGFFKIVFFGIGYHSSRMLNQVFENFDSQKSWKKIIWIYFIINLIPLIYPEFRLYQLFYPPTPDLTTTFQLRFQVQELDYVLKVIEYLQILLTPFFYIALYKYRYRIRWVIIIIFLLSYIHYVNTGYIGRGYVLTQLSCIWISLWIFRPKVRSKLLIGTLMLAPFALGFSYVYSIIRIGGNLNDFNLLGAISTIVEKETSFPRDVGVALINSGEQVNLYEYIKWIVTLSIPKIFIGEIEGARINYEISEIILGLNQGGRGWYVVLPGLIAESIYLFGKYFFWLHAVFIACLTAFIVRLVERNQQLLFFNAYIIIHFAYVLNRGGIASLLPVLFNEFMLFYIYVFIVVFGVNKKSKANRVANKYP